MDELATQLAFINCAGETPCSVRGTQPLQKHTHTNTQSVCLRELLVNIDCNSDVTSFATVSTDDMYPERETWSGG